MSDPSDAAVRTAVTLEHALARLARATTRTEVAAVATEAIRGLLGSDDAALVLRDGDRQESLVVLGARGLAEEGQVVPSADCPASSVVRGGSAIAVADVLDEPTMPLLHPATRGLCVVPVGEVPGEPRVGALAALWDDPHLTTAGELRVLASLGSAAGLAVSGIDLRAELAAASSERRRQTARVDDLQVALRTLAHDLRSPLGAMLGYAEMIRDDVADDPAAVRRTAGRVVAASGRMNRQIERMLGLYEGAAQPLSPAPLDLTLVARAVVEEVLIGLDRDVVVDVAPGLRAVADADLVRVVLHNLVANAVKFTSARPVAHVRVGRAGRAGAPVPPPEAAAHDDRHLVWFYVEDDGVGFDPADSHRLFRPLARLHADAFPGTGLGLASVAWIVGEHGGRVHAEPLPGPGGARIWFALPAERGAPNGPASPRTVPLTALR